MFRSLLNVYVRAQNLLMELLFPTRCIGCRQPPNLLCHSCKKTIRYRTHPSIAPATHAAVVYRHRISERIIKTLKYKGDRRAAMLSAQLLWESCGEIITDTQALEVGNIILTGIPSSPQERKNRNLNHTDALVQALREQYLNHEKFTFVPGALAKISDTPRQVSLSREKRLHNLQNTFTVPQPQAVQDNIVFVFDDVTTTGATFTEARRALYEAGAKEVICFSVAH